jgi:hypothetical protein
MTLFQNIVVRELISNKEKESIKEQKITEKNKKESKESKETNRLNNLSPKTKEHRMNRNKSIENFVKYSWSWTI